jgi:hypothetical protein
VTLARVPVWRSASSAGRCRRLVNKCALLAGAVIFVVLFPKNIDHPAASHFPSLGPFYVFAEQFGIES